MRKTRGYFVANGNNAELVRREFRARAEWSPALKASELAALNQSKGYRKVSDVSGGRTQFVWCQYRSSLGDFAQYACKGRAALLNHFDGNAALVSKRGLAQCLEAAGHSHVAPWTRVVSREMLAQASSGSAATSAASAIVEEEVFQQQQEREAVFILKPGHGSNRGAGIVVVQGAAAAIEALHAAAAAPRSQRCQAWVVQRYIERPLLVDQRKFDIRCYALLTFNARLQGSERRDNSSSSGGWRLYLHQRAYLRTSSRKYTLGKGNLGDRMVHLTNDAVQSKGASYGALEAANKLSLSDFAVAIGTNGEQKVAHYWEGIKAITQTTVASALGRLNPKGRDKCFELFGLDFMVDAPTDRVLLIEVNENPCLQQVCPLLERTIPKVVADTLELVLDVNFASTAAEERLPASTNEFQPIYL